MDKNSPILVLVLFAGVPLALLFLCCYFVPEPPNSTVKPLSWSSFRYKIAFITYKYAHIMGIGFLFFGSFLCFLQVQFAFGSLCFSVDIDYYLTVNNPSYDAMTAISGAQDFNSLATSGYLSALALTTKGALSRARLQHTASSTNFHKLRGKKGSHRILTNASTFETSVHLGRRLGNYETSTLSLVYHNDDSPWSNVLTEDYLVSLCLAEQSIIASVGCINSNDPKSLLLNIFDSNCNYKMSFSETSKTFTLAENEAYVEDNCDGRSSILISYYQLGSCHDIYSSSQFQTALDDALYPDSGVSLTFVEVNYMYDDFVDAIVDAGKISAISLVVCVCFLVVGIRGFILAITTLLCVVISVSHAAAVLVCFGYSCFSAFNVMSVFILIGVGVNAVLLYAFAWRRVEEERGARRYANNATNSPLHQPSVCDVHDGEDVIPEDQICSMAGTCSNNDGSQSDDKISLPIDEAVPSTESDYVEEGISLIIEVYQRVGSSILFTTLAAILSLFSKLISPVIVISQLGAFMGVAVIVFYVCFHFIIIPMYIYTSKWRLTSRGGSMQDTWFGVRSRTHDAFTSSSFSNRSDAGHATSHCNNVDDQEDVIVKGECEDCSSSSSEGMEPLLPHRIGNSSEQPMRRRKSNEDRLSDSSHESTVAHKYTYSYVRTHWKVSTIVAVIILLVTGAALFVIYLEVMKIIEPDLGIPQLFPPKSNLGTYVMVMRVSLQWCVSVQCGGHRSSHDLSQGL